MSSTTHSWVRRRPLVVFSVGAFGLGWPVASLPALAEHGLIPGPAVPLPAVVLGVTFAVLLPAALLATLYAEGRAGVLRLLGRGGQWRLGVRGWMLVVLAVPGGTVALGVALGGSVTVDAPDLLAALLSVVTAFALIHLAEELVWAGFVQTRLARRTGTMRAAVLTAVPFAAIHLPLTLVGPVSVRSVLIDVGGLLLLAVVLRALIGVALEWSAGSVVAAAAMHASFNAANNAHAPADSLLSGVDPGLLAPAAAVLATGAVLASLSRRRATAAPTTGPSIHTAGTISSRKGTP